MKSTKMAMFMITYVVIQLLFQSTEGFILPSILWSSRQQQNERDLAIHFNHRILAGSNYGFPFQHLPTRCSRIFSEISDTGRLSDAEDLRAKLKGTCLFLVGMMGSGKSTVGKLIAERLSYRFIDTDEVAEYMIDMPIADFFAAGNETQFRTLEYQILMDLAQYTRVVVSTGGGIVLKPENWGLLHHGVVVYLDMEAQDIYDRLARDPEQVKKRPLLQTTASEPQDAPLEKLKTLKTEREQKYKQADVTVKISPDLSPDQVADKVVNTIVTFIAENPPMWQNWKQQRNSKALDFAAMTNPKAAMSMSSEVDPTKKRGSVQYVALSDIKSGKVKLPQGPPPPGSLPSPGKGFAPIINTNTNTGDNELQ